MIHQSIKWEDRIEKAAGILQVPAAELEKIITDKLDIICITELDDEEVFTLESFKKRFKDIGAVQVKQAFEALRQVDER